jgi:hypothetical protein
MEKFIATTINEYLNEQSFGNVKLYHRLSNKSNLDLTQFIKSVITKGLIRHDNGEIGNVIWFSKEYGDYAKNANFVVSIDYNEKNRKKYQISYDNHNGYAYNDIPFKELEVIKIPVLSLRNQITSSEDAIRLIDTKVITTERLNNLENVVIYGDIFNKYVQPFIKSKNFIDELDSNKIKIINVF